MKLSEVIFALEELKPGYLTSDEAKRYVSLLDSGLSVSPISYSDEDAALLIEEPYSELYLLFLKAEAELKLGEIENYNNTFILFRSLLDEYKRFKVRSGNPIKKELKLL